MDRNLTKEPTNDYQALITLNKEFLTFHQLPKKEGLLDYSRVAVEKQKQGLPIFFDRLRAIDPSQWPVSQKINYLLVKAQLNKLDFTHRVLRPWFRDPCLYVYAMRAIAFAYEREELPLSDEDLTKLHSQLKAVPSFLEQAKENLTEGAGELVKLALRNLQEADGVGSHQPFREVPPAGVIGWYKDLVERLEKNKPELVPAGKKALEAVLSFLDWLQDNQGKMTASAGVGLDNYNWYLKNVLYMPFTAQDCLTIGDRELHRSWTFLKIEHNKNRNQPILEPAASKEEYERRIAEADKHVRKFIREEGILTIPENVRTSGHNVPWIVRPGGKRNFWEEIQLRDPRPDHVHAVIPGHRFDALIKRLDTRPIRGPFRDSGRSEGWATYLEEMFLQAGLLDELPRTRELYYLFQIARAVRLRPEVKMHSNDFTVEDAVNYMVDHTPFMDENVARVDAEIYLRRPTAGISYYMGKIQMDQLVHDRAEQLGDKFILKEFHDQFLDAGTIPLSLMRWEMTGLDDEVKEFWT